MKSNHKNFHKDRVVSHIKSILNKTLQEEIYDKEIRMASFTDIILSPDYSSAKIFVDTFDRSKIDVVVTHLNQAKGVFRTNLAGGLTIHRIPELKFFKDDTIDASLKIEKLFQKINEEK